MSVKTSHIRPIDHNINGLLPTLPGRKAKLTEQAKENIWLVAVISVWWNVDVTPAESSMLCK